MTGSWNELREGAERILDKISSEAVRLGDAASMQIKLESCRNRLEKEYALLGKLTYSKLKGGNDNTEQIDAALSRISELRAAEKDIERDIKNAKAEAEAIRKAEKAAKAAD